MPPDGAPAARDGARWSRRRALALLVGATLAPRDAAAAIGRYPVGGRLTLRLPWATATVDPHAIDDPLAMILGAALFESLYGPSDGGAVIPILAEGPPERAAASGRWRVSLRSGVRTGQGHAIDAHAVVASLGRARARGARAVLAPFGVPRAEGPWVLSFPASDGSALGRALASPVTAVVPPTFHPGRPDGTGPFRAAIADGALLLTRNDAAAPPSFLDACTLHGAADVAASLRAFEAGTDDIGWLGAGLHEARAGAAPFDYGAVGWVVLRTGREARAWDAPGVAQRLADGLPPDRLAYLALGPPWDVPQPTPGWGGAPCELLVREDAPWLVEVARAVAATLSRPGHEVAARPVPYERFAARRLARAFALALDLARPVLDDGAVGALLGLATADDGAAAEDVARHPPRLGPASPRTLTRTLRLGVVGEVRVQGSRVPDAVVPAARAGGIDWGAAFRAPRGA